MKSLGSDFKRLKKSIQQKEDEYKKINQILNNFFSKNFSPQKTTSFLKSFYIKNKTLYLETTHKIIAQELYLHKPQLLEEVKDLADNIRIK